MKQNNKDNEGAPSKRAQSLGTKKNTKKRSSSKPRCGRPSVNLDGAQDAGLSSSLTEQRRNTYKPEDNAFDERAPMAFQLVEHVYVYHMLWNISILNLQVPLRPILGAVSDNSTGWCLN